jgi:superkiller protein 3
VLRHAWETLIVCFPEEKDKRRDTVWRIAHGMVVLNLPDELAWTICVDWKDFELIGALGIPLCSNKLEMYGKMFIQDLIKAVPQSGLAKVVSAYLLSEISGFPPDSPIENGGQENKEESPAKIPPEEILDDMIA